MSRMQVYLTFDPPGRARSMLEEQFQVTAWTAPGFAPFGVLSEHLPTVDGLYCTLTTRVNETLLDMAPRLKVVSQCAVGVNNIDLDACRSRGIAVGHTPDVLTETTADTAFGLLIAGSRRFGEGIDFVRQGDWREFDMNLLLGRDVHNSVIGIVGFGRIGQAVAHRAAGFGMEVLYTRRTQGPPHPYGRHVTFDELLDASDHVVLTAPLTPETTGMINASALRRMKPTAGLINVGRGPLVVTDDLVQGLREGWIRYAALDVVDPEPITNGHPLLSLPNCIVLPHLGSSSEETRNAMAELAAANLIAGLSGKRMPARIA